MALQLRPAPPDFDGQFLLSPDPLPADPLAGTPHAGRAVALPSLHLRVYPQLAAATVEDGAGAAVGVLLGFPLDVALGRRVEGARRFDEVWTPDDPGGWVERNVYPLCGSWAFVLDAPGPGGGRFRRLHLDAGLTRPAVYRPEDRLAAATAPLLLGAEESARRLDRELHAFLSIHDDGWYPAGLTAHEGVSALIRNHYLDLDRFEPVRHWGLWDLDEGRDPRVLVEDFVAQIRRVIDAAMAAPPTAQCLTAGYDSRLLLAACRDIAPEIDFVTVENRGDAIDRACAADIARRFGLRHRALKVVRAGPEAQAVWHARNGHTVGGANMSDHPTVDPLAGLTSLIGGAGGEIGGAYYRRDDDRREDAVTADALLARYGMPRHPRVRAATEAWLRSVAESHAPMRPDAFQLLDLAYLELRSGCWNFPSVYAPQGKEDIHPILGRRNVTAMMSAPADWKKGRRLMREGIALAWPELLEVPFNAYGDWRDTARLVSRAARNPRLVVKKLRKRFG